MASAASQSCFSRAFSLPATNATMEGVEKVCGEGFDVTAEDGRRVNDCTAGAAATAACAACAAAAAAAAAAAEANKIFVGGLLKVTTEDEIKEFFSQFGTVVEVLLKREAATGISRGFGFVTFADDVSLQKALQNYNHNAISGKWVDVRRAEPESQQFSGTWKGGQQAVMPALPDEAEGRKLFLGGLAAQVSEADIAEYFSQFGAVAEALVKRDHEGRSRGFGFCTFAEPDAMERALSQYESIVLGGKWVEVRAAGGYKGHSKGVHWRASPY
uniref:RRM domain-containing protein n=1 Tax=Pyrodinium bahamense TaxID=73915 RepID=A0A7S0AKH3_9DINO|mmetsp:Transcript_35512/g.98262  ORF Transcript_35512/g.98262 Transcript_35512/m.98262 type:complete len:272 (+) Transcript_35512:381-1196(+)